LSKSLSCYRGFRPNSQGCNLSFGQLIDPRIFVFDLSLFTERAEHLVQGEIAGDIVHVDHKGNSFLSRN
jgi:hypothetical protein